MGWPGIGRAALWQRAAAPTIKGTRLRLVRFPAPSPLSPSAAAPRGLTPDTRLRASVEVPVSKSVAQRAVLAAALTHGTTRLVGIDGRALCADVAAALGVARGLGAELEFVTPRALTVEGHSPARSRFGAATGAAPGTTSGVSLEVGESGTLARLATAIAALCMRGEVTITGNGTLFRRTSPPLYEALLRAGVRLRTRTATRSSGWPVTLRGIGPPSDLFLNDPVSSQELTALLLVAASYPDPIRVHVQGVLPSAPYVEITRRCLAVFGVSVVELPEEAVGDKSRRVFEAGGVMRAPEDPYMLDADASAAAVALTAGAIGGQELAVEGSFGASGQGDVRIADHLRAMGAEVHMEARAMRVSGTLVRGLDVDLTETPDLVPPLAVAACAAALRHGAASRLAGLGTLRGKESDRIAVLTAALSASGVDVQVGGCDREPNLTVRPPSGAREPSAVTLDPAGDHRMAFAGALLGLVVPGIRVAAPEVVAKSWPGFWEALDGATS